MNHLLALLLVSLSIVVTLAADSGKAQHDYLRQRHIVHRKLTTYEDYWWRELPSAPKAAATTIGYDEHSWDNSMEIDIDPLDWSQLTPTQRSAATTLGYDQLGWDEASSFDEYDFNELGPIALAHAKALGFTQSKW